MLLQPPGLRRQDSESLKPVQERWRPLPRDQTHGGSGEGWVESVLGSLLRVLLGYNSIFSEFLPITRTSGPPTTSHL